MNKKLIAAAVSAAVVAPVASQADVTVYGRINNALRYTDNTDADSTTDIANISSRVGVKASAELGNGMTARARYEFSTFTDKEGVEGGHGGINDTRIGTVGLSGNFGSIDVGNQWSAYFNYIGTYMDPTYSLGYYLYSSTIGGPYRQSNAIAYSNTWGPVSMQLDVRIQEPNEQNSEKIGAEDGAGLGLSWQVTDNLVLAGAVDSQDAGADSHDRAGLAAQWAADNWSVALSFQDSDFDNGDEREAVYLQGTFNVGEKGRILLGGGSGENGDADPTQVYWGYYHSMGGGLRLYYEGTAFDNDRADIGDVDEDFDFNQHLFGMRIDF